MKTFFKTALSCLCISLFFLSCSDSKNEPSENAKLTPEQNKAKLEQIGLKAISKINAADHAELLKTMDTFARLADEGELEIEENQAAMSLIKEVRNICAKSNLGRMLRFADPESELYNVAQYYGIYTYNKVAGRWDFESSDSKLEFRFSADGKSAVLVIACSDKETEVEIDDETRVMVPAKMESALTLGDKELYKLVLNNSIDNASHRVELNSELSASGYVFTTSVIAGMELASCDFILKKGSEQLIFATCNVTGKGMTDHPENSDNPEDLFNTAGVSVNLMDDMNISASCSDIKAMLKLIDSLTGDDDSQSYNDKLAQSINKYSKAEMRYAGSDEVIAAISVQPYLEDSYQWNGTTREYWDVEPVLVFTVDGSKHSFDSYFDEIAFNDLINSAEDLGETYQKYLNYLAD